MRPMARRKKTNVFKTSFYIILKYNSKCSLNARKLHIFTHPPISILNNNYILKGPSLSHAKSGKNIVCLKLVYCDSCENMISRRNIFLGDTFTGSFSRRKGFKGRIT